MQLEEYSLKRIENASDRTNLFEDCAWLYELCREYLFRDHTEQIIHSLFPSGLPAQSAQVLEVGCGPGFYARRLARRFEDLDLLGIDRSPRMVSSARRRAKADGLTNCRFVVGDVEQLCDFVEPVDAIISSRLLLVVTDPSRVMAELFRVLKPGGSLFLAEPTARVKTHLPLSAMRLVYALMPPSRRLSGPWTANILASRQFRDLIHSQPWLRCSFQRHGDYQCCVCRKGFPEPADADELLMAAGSISDDSRRSP